jgi:hypothetical protein
MLSLVSIWLRIAGCELFLKKSSPTSASVVLKRKAAFAGGLSYSMSPYGVTLLTCVAQLLKAPRVLLH